MTAAPEPRARLALVAIHPSLHMVGAPRRSGSAILGNVPRSPTHQLAYHRCILPVGTTTLCPQNEAKTYVQLSLSYSTHHGEMHRYNDDPDRQHGGPKELSNPRPPILWLSPQAQEKKTRSPGPLDGNDQDLGQSSFTTTKHFRFRHRSPDAGRWSFGVHNQ